MSDSSVDRNPLEALAEEFLERFRRGERPALSEYTGKHPALADDIRELFPALVMLEDVRPASAPHGGSARRSDSPGARLERVGDYRILREVGRGGMGIVYEAEQESLGRHVALKVLPAHALLEPRQLERFQREARSAARLHHTNIVPVFGVGEQDGLHYYVMQFIHGQGLDQVLAVLQRLRKNTHDGNNADSRPASSRDMASAAAVANALLTGVFASPPDTIPKTELRQPDPTGRQNGADVEEVAAVSCSPTQSGSVASSSAVRLPGQPKDATLSESGQPYWHSVARIGIQVADALAYAHAQGTLHRDIKPANLLLDTQGIVWVTDFGLAKAAGSENLTHTGDVVGTLRYMAPERFRGKADARSDVYGLGLTLYELLTLEPAFGESERDKLLLQVMQQEPARPRKLNPAVPRDLETIVLKAIARDPQHRYQSAFDLAADLQRFTEDKPIQARPVSEVEKMWRWCRRNPSLALALTAFMTVLLLGLAGTSFMWYVADLERKRSALAEGQTAVERDNAVTARSETQQLLAGALLDRGIALAEQGEVSEGLLWMREALQAVPPGPSDLTRVIRTNLAAWLEQAHRLEHFTTQTGSFRACAFTPDSRLWTGGSSGVEVWREGRPVDLVKNKTIAAMAVSPDGSILVTEERPMGGPGVLQLRSTATGQPLGDPLRHPGNVQSAVFALDGKMIVTGDDQGIVRRWDVATRKSAGDPWPHRDRRVVDQAVSPDGRTLAVATGVPSSETRPAELYLWDLVTGKPLREPLPHQGLILSVAFAPDGKTVLAGCHDRTAQLWDVATGKPVGRPLAHARPVTVVRFTPDGRTIATGSQDGLIHWWDAATGTPLIGTLSLKQAHIVDLAFNADGKRLAAVSNMGANRRLVHTFALARAAARPPSRNRETLLKASWTVGEGESWLGRYRVAHSPDAAFVVSGGPPRRARLCDAATGQPRLGAGGPDGPLWNAWPAVGVNAISPDGRFIATSSRDVTVVAEVRLWDAAIGRPIGVPLPHGNHVSALAFSPDSQILATGSYDGSVQFWESATGRRTGRLPQPDMVLSLAFSPDGKTLAVGHANTRGGPYGVVLWNVTERQPVMAPRTGPSYLVQFSPDGQLLLGNSGSELCFWETTTGQLRSPAIDEVAEINSAAFSPDSRTVLLSTTDGTVWLRHVPSGKPAGAPMRNPVRANVAVFSPDPEAHLIVAGYDDGSVRFWDRATQKPLGPRLQQGGRIAAATFTPNGRFCVTSSQDGNTRRWRVPAPLDDDLDRLTARLQGHTGLRMGEAQTVFPLDATRSPGLSATQHAARPVAISDVEFHDLRAREAELDKDVFAARWHLGHLLAGLADSAPAAGAPPLWQVYARRARLATTHHQFAQAEADYAAALKHGAPDRLAGWYRYRLIDCVAAKNAAAAVWYADRAVALAPDDWHAYADRADAMGQLGKADERDADLTRAADHGAESTFLGVVGDDHARRRLWKKSATAYEQAATRGPTDAAVWQHHALVRLKLDDRAGYAKHCRRLVEAEGGTDIAAVANNLAWVCALGPDGLADYARLIDLAERVVRGARSDDVRAGSLNTLGAILYRAGRYQDAITRLNESIKLRGGSGSDLDWLFLAMAHHRLGETTRARTYLARVTPCPPEHAFSFDCLEIDVLYREAHAMLTEPAARTTYQ
jgi:WD40 repeat protein/serine/threonine protein kinase